MMPNEKRRKVKEIVLKIGDKNKTIQGITEQITCGDVIKMVLRKMDNSKENAYSYAIFESGNGSERMLTDKTRVLKTMRSWGSDTSFHFSLKAARRASKIFKAKQDKVGKSDKATNDLNVDGKIESAAKLAHFVQSQKTRLQKRQTTNHMTEIYCNDAETSIDEFISNVDETKMAGFLNFCGAVTANELVRLSSVSDNSSDEQSGFVSGKEISRIDKINNVKYATKKVLKPKRVSVTYGQSNTGMPRKHTFVDCSHRNVPTHSTPTRDSSRPLRKRHEELANDITAKISRMNQKEGKDVILQKYFADYLSYNSPKGRPFPMPKRERGDGTSFSKGNPDKGDGSFSTRTPLLSSTTHNRRLSDSDSGQEDHDHEDHFDNAFICTSDTKSTDSKPRYAQVKSLSRKLVNYDVTMATKTSKLVDYSFSDTSVLDSDESSLVLAERNIFDEDEEMASFMDSKLYDDLSDEGLSSLGSEDDKEILV